MQTPYVPAIVTPFHPGSLEVDVDSFKKYLEVSVCVTWHAAACFTGTWPVPLVWRPTEARS